MTFDFLVEERRERMDHPGADIRVVGFVVVAVGFVGVAVRFVGAGKPFQRGAWDEDAPT